jgi:hypothetical protein
MHLVAFGTKPKWPMSVLAVANEGISDIDVWDRDVASDPNADVKDRLTRFNLMQTGALFPK